MQVNVKELTGVLHLNLVFMNVLVLQSFLAVFPKCHQSSQVCCVNYSKLPAFSSVLSSPSSKLTPSTSQVCQLFQAPSAFFTSRVLSVTPLSSCLS